MRELNKEGEEGSGGIREKIGDTEGDGVKVCGKRTGRALREI